MKAKLQNNTIFTIIAANSGLFILLGAMVFITFVAAPWVESVISARLPQPQPVVEEQPKPAKTINIFVLERGSGNMNNAVIGKLLEAATRVVEHEQNIAVAITTGDFSTFDAFSYDIIVLQNYDKDVRINEDVFLEDTDPATSRIASFVSSGKMALALDYPFAQDNTTLREVFGAYFVGTESVKHKYTVLQRKHPLAKNLPASFASSYDTSTLGLDVYSNPTVKTIVENELGEPAATVADYRNGKAIAITLSFHIWTPVPAFNTPASQIAKSSEQVRVLANAIEFAATQR
ncbi:MAG: hypothetical protein QMD08_01845 [Actinomycetota bacterium]|nr:hypothetical protein [Actinomycetota bacterium]